MAIPTVAVGEASIRMVEVAVGVTVIGAGVAVGGEHLILTNDLRSSTEVSERMDKAST